MGIYASDPMLTNKCNSLHRLGNVQGGLEMLEKCLGKFVHRSQVSEYASRARGSSSLDNY
jgi:hypothetical protein